MFCFSYSSYYVPMCTWHISSTTKIKFSKGISLWEKNCQLGWLTTLSQCCWARLRLLISRISVSSICSFLILDSHYDITVNYFTKDGYVKLSRWMVLMLIIYKECCQSNIRTFCYEKIKKNMLLQGVIRGKKLQLNFHKTNVKYQIVSTTKSYLT